MTTPDLKQQLATKAATVPAKNEGRVDPAQQIQAYLTRMGPEIAKACGSQIKADELGRVALTTIRLNPTLLACNVQSLMAGVMQAAQLGLRIDPTLGQAYLVPFNRKIKVPGKADQWTKEAEFIIGYRGLLTLIRNSGAVSSIMAHPVYVNDHFILQYGMEEKLEHVPWHCRTDGVYEQGGPFRGAYCVAKLKDGGVAHLYMPKQEIDAHRSRSKSKDDGPWITDYEAMALKTVVKGIAKWLPMSIDDLNRIAQDETVKTEIRPDMTEVVNLAETQYEAIEMGGAQGAKSGAQGVNVATGEVPLTQDEKKSVQDDLDDFPDPPATDCPECGKKYINGACRNTTCPEGRPE